MLVLICVAGAIADSDSVQQKPVHLINLKQSDYPIVTDRIQNALERINRENYAKWTLEAIVGAKRELGMNNHFVLKAKIQVAPHKFDVCDIDIVERTVAVKCGAITHKKHN